MLLCKENNGFWFYMIFHEEGLKNYLFYTCILVLDEGYIFFFTQSFVFIYGPQSIYFSEISSSA